MDYVKFISAVPNAFTVTSGTTWSGVDESYLLSEGYASGVGALDD